MSYLRTGMCPLRLWCLNHSNLHHFHLWLWLKCLGNPICSSAAGWDFSPAISCLKHQFVFITINSNLLKGNLRDFSCEKWLFHQRIHVHSHYVVYILCQWVTTKTRNLETATGSYKYHWIESNCQLNRWIIFNFLNRGNTNTSLFTDRKPNLLTAWTYGWLSL